MEKIKSMRKNKKGVMALLMNPWVILVLILLIVFLFSGIFTGSLISISGMEIQKQDYVFDGISGTAESPFFGGLTNQPNTAFCGNDEDVTISNNIIGGNQLVLTSTLKASSRSCGDNFIRTTLDLPAGVLKGTCKTSAQDDDWSEASAGCEVGDFSYNNRAKARGVIAQGSQDFEIILGNSQTIDVIITAGGVRSANSFADSSATLTLNFEEELTDDPHSVDLPHQSIEFIEDQATTSQNFLSKFFQSISDFFSGLFG